MRFRVLGPVGAEGPDGRPLGDRQRALLASLLARAGQVVAADQLAELLWGEEQPADPAAALQSQVSRLRRAIAPATIETRAPGYLLAVGPEELDALRFDQLVAQAGDASAAVAEALLREALELWRGEAYAEFAETPVARFAALRLAEARRNATEAWFRAMLDSGQAALAMPQLEAFVAEYPLREQARAVLMRTLYALDRHADALAVYTEYERRLVDELGLEPSAGIQDLRLAILRRDLAPPPSPASDREPGPEQSPASDPGEGSTSKRLPLSDLKVGYITDPAGHAIATATIGSGPPLVALPGWVSSIDVVASGRDLRSSLLQRLVDTVTMTVYDRYGTGRSPGEVDDYGLDASVDELVAVVEHIGGPVTLLAMSQGGPVALAVAARRPDLVDRLVLVGTYASAPVAFARPDLNAALVAMVRSHWGMASRLFAELYRPNSTDDVARHLAEVLQDSAGPEVAANYLAALYDVDVADLLPLIQAPALVVHYRGDRLIPFAGGRQLAAGLSQARLVALDGPYHLPDARDLDRIVTAVADFVTGKGVRRS